MANAKYALARSLTDIACTPIEAGDIVTVNMSVFDGNIVVESTPNGLRLAKISDAVSKSQIIGSVEGVLKKV